MGERVSEGLERAGYPACKGGMMARNPRWCAPLSTWKENFSSWVGIAEPTDLLDFNTCFDFRSIHGDEALVHELRRHVAAELARTPSFFVQLAQNALHFKPPLSFFGQIVADTDPHGTQKTLNLKEATVPIVSFARLYALHRGIQETSTFERLERLHEKGVLARIDGAEVSQAYDFLMSLRLSHQVEGARSGLFPTNQVKLEELTSIEVSTLKLIFSRIASLQKKIAFEFLGGAWAQGA
jgi:CBS domain-containing protein